MAAVRNWPALPIVVVLGAHAEEILEQVELGDCLVVVNPEWEEGIASSLRVGLDLLAREGSAEWAFIALADQPRIPADVPPTLLAVAEETERAAVVPVYRYQRGNPVLVRRRLWPHLMSLQGDVGAAPLLQAHPGWVQEVRFDHPAPADLDLPGDIADLS